MTDLTTGQIAKLVGVAPRTVKKWIDEGLLRGYRLPTPRGDRRVTRAAFDAFCREHELVVNAPHGLPLDDDPNDDGPNPPPIAEAALGPAETRRAA